MSKPSMANLGVRRGRGKPSWKRVSREGIFGPVPRRSRSCLQKRGRPWGKDLSFDAHSGFVKLDAKSSIEHGPPKNPESQNVENRVTIKLRNPKGKVEIEGRGNGVELNCSTQHRRVEEMGNVISEINFIVDKGLHDSPDLRANKCGSVPRRSVCKGPPAPRNKRRNRSVRFLRKTDSGLHSRNNNLYGNAIFLPLNEGDLAHNRRITIVDCKDGDSTTSQLQSSSLSGREKVPGVNPRHMPTGLLIDVDDEHEETCKRRPSRNRANKKAERLVCRNQVWKQDKQLDTDIIDKYLEQLWKKLPEEKQKSCTYLDCLWFSMYLKGAVSDNILKWTKAKCIFTRRYVFIPIVHWSHWNLLILCHFGEDFGTQARTPCMLLLDSLKETDPNRLEPLIRKFLIEIYKEEGRQDGDKIIAKIPLLVPEVPQQTNGSDCGVFLLHFIDLFLESAPENFSIYDGCYPYFLTRSWFNCDDIRNRRKHIYNMLLEEQHCVSKIIDRRISTRSKKFHRFVHTDHMSNCIDLSSID